MSGYVCPHCSDVVGVFGQGGGEDFCRREEERKDSQVEGEGGGCGFLGRIPIDRELVALLDGAADVRVVSAEEALGGTSTRVEEAESRPRTLVERYASIPSFPIVQQITRKVVEMIDAQEVKEGAERVALGI